MADLPTHDDRIRDQFTKQAAPFARKMAAAERMNFPLLRRLTGVNSTDRVLDVACGPGLIACAFAEEAGEVTGLDLTPAMPDRARALQAEKGLTNLRWELGDVYQLPYEEAAFSLVVTRFSFHHLTEPNVALRELVRVCMPAGRVCVIDMVTTEEASAAFNAVEKFRDPSHVEALVADELTSLASAAGLVDVQSADYWTEFGVEEQLRASAVEPDEAERFRAAIRADVGRDALGVKARFIDGECYYSYRSRVVVGRKLSHPQTAGAD